MLGDEGHHAAPVERRTPCQQLIEQAAERVEIRASIDVRLAKRLLGTQIQWRPDHDAGGRETFAALRGIHGDGAGYTEVREQRAARMAEHVFRLEVAVDDSLAVRVREGFRKIGHDGYGIRDGQSVLAVEPMPQRLALYQWHHEKHAVAGGARVEQRQNRRMDEPRGDADLEQEAIAIEVAGAVGVEHLDGNVAAEDAVVRPPHGRHSAAAEDVPHFVSIAERDRGVRIDEHRRSVAEPTQSCKASPTGTGVVSASGCLP